MHFVDGAVTGWSRSRPHQRAGSSSGESARLLSGMLGVRSPSGAPLQRGYAVLEHRVAPNPDKPRKSPVGIEAVTPDESIPLLRGLGKDQGAHRERPETREETCRFGRTDRGQFRPLGVPHDWRAQDDDPPAPGGDRPALHTTHGREDVAESRLPTKNTGTSFVVGSKATKAY